MLTLVYQIYKPKSLYRYLYIITRLLNTNFIRFDNLNTLNERNR